MKLTEPVAQQLKGQKNLLAFSGGADSTALFYLLLDAGITFDIAIVNYHMRTQSDEECVHAQRLATQHGLQCHVHDAPTIDANFEHAARLLRYDFFETLITQYGYANLLTAHHLGDRLEWLLMQMCKGAGLLEMAGMQALEVQEGYCIVRPLLGYAKEELTGYLQKHGHSWYEDESNRDARYKRNYFRHRFSEPMLQEFRSGIAKSFEYLDEDRASLTDTADVKQFDALYFFKTRPQRRATLAIIDKLLKRNGFLMRQGDREALKEQDCIVAGRRYVIAISEGYTMIAPYEEAVMDKAFKEACRQLRIAPKLRGYLYNHPNVYKAVASLV